MRRFAVGFRANLENYMFHRRFVWLKYSHDKYADAVDRRFYKKKKMHFGMIERFKHSAYPRL